jgi:hypothetical protein
MLVQYQTSVVALPLWVVYAHSDDYPDSFVARLWDLLTNLPTSSHLLAPTLDALRLRLPPDLHRMERAPHDEPHIVETWI